MFKYIIKITPLGFLYGSAGAFLSPENLVGRSGNSFPPSSATVSGLYAYKYANDDRKIQEKLGFLPNLQIAGPFWAKNDHPENFYVPTPLNYLIKLDDEIEKGEVAKTGEIQHQLTWDKDKKQWLPSVTGKYDSDTWIPIKKWNNPETVWDNPWQYKPNLHPKINKQQRIVDKDEGRGSLFLENAVQMHPETCLVYLTTEQIEDGWYRFGGEGHLVELECLEITDNYLQDLLGKETGDFFALITPAVWGSNHLSYQFPIVRKLDKREKQEQDHDLEPEDSIGQTPLEWDKDNAQLITERAKPYRYRLGGEGKTKRLSRGRYAVPAGTVYPLEKAISKSWLDWDDDWFPYEGYCYKRWGCGLALPLPSVTNSTEGYKACHPCQIK